METEYKSLAPLISLTKGEVAWYPVDWNVHEKSWQSTCGEIMAVVSEARARLVYFGSLDGSQNLLATPAERKAIDDNNPWPDWGGHRFWLGPQKRWAWPPLPEWEHSPASSCIQVNDTMLLTMPQIDKSYPRIAKSYRWHKGRLESQALWRSNGLPCYSMHVIAVPPVESLHLQTNKTEAAPQGYLVIEREGTRCLDLPNVMPSPKSDFVSLTPKNPNGIKVGFPCQRITVPRGPYTLSMAYGEHSGQVSEEVDKGYRSQIWVRQPHPFNEIEQISPYLTVPNGEWAGHSIYLSATRS